MNSSQPLVSCCRVSIIIKALNEEKRIVEAVESALAAVQPLGGEVVLADSYSTDRTVTLASAYPIRIVQLANAAERCCGIGPQLGYQHSCGEYVYILDGDMKMLPGFLPQAIAYLDAHVGVAGVGGRVVEMNTTSLEYLARVERGMAHMQAGEVDRLDMGGLYRRAAIEKTGYFSDRNLHSYEEFDLAVRLRARGWTLWRIDQDAVQHHGHDAPPYQLLMRRWRSRYINGLGELLRGAWGQPHFEMAVAGLRELRIYLLVLGWWLALLSLLLLSVQYSKALAAFLALLLAPFVLMTMRKRSLSKAMFSVVSWCFNTAGLLRGLVALRKLPTEPVHTATVKQLGGNQIKGDDRWKDPNCMPI
jgi:glycosyltransferase involved in cell wall biosynthesis